MAQGLLEQSQQGGRETEPRLSHLVVGRVGGADGQRDRPRGSLFPNWELIS
jgi:hypothetical protein